MAPPVFAVVIGAPKGKCNGAWLRRYLFLNGAPMAQQRSLGCVGKKPHILTAIRPRPFRPVRFGSTSCPGTRRLGKPNRAAASAIYARTRDQKTYDFSMVRHSASC